MYFWKCWRETRISFYVFLLIAAVLAVLPWKIMDYAMSDLGARQFFALAWMILVFGSSALLSVAGMSLGATGISEEFAHKTAGFLLTKPRSIRYFVWTGWAANAVQFLALTGTMVLVRASILLWRCHVPLTGRLLLTFVPGLIMTLLMFGMTYLLGVVSRLSWKWRKRSSVKITERIHEETTEALHAGRESLHSEEAFGGRSADLGYV